ncbi:MAG: nucleotidyltransferase [Thermodesulfobacteriota bacterium]|nr:nucleotidyltransferase [Thermodesulfobacteriota bacterium]
MEDRDDYKPPRPPAQHDLITLCRELNACGVKYIVIGGMAVVQQGFLRTTEDIDLLLEESRKNQQKVKKALEILPDKAVLEMDDDDLDTYVVVRVVDEIVVDLMLKACGISYNKAIKEVDIVTIKGVDIPFASAELLFKMKQTVRQKDEIDRIYLKRKIEVER